MTERIEPHDARGFARLVAAVHARLERAERDALEEVDLTPPLFRLLDGIARGGPTGPADAARQLAARPAAITGWAKALRTRGLLEPPGDGGAARRAPLRLTPEGERVHLCAAERVRRGQTRVLAAVDPHLQADLAQALARISEAGEEGEEDAARSGGDRR